MTDLPTKDAILDWIEDNPTASKGDVARAFGLRGAAKVDLKAMLREMEAEGALEPRRKRRARADEGPPPVGVIEVTGTDADGDVLARPHGAEGPVLVVVSPEGMGRGDRALAKITPVDGGWEARVIRRLQPGRDRVLGIFRRDSAGGRIMPIDKGQATQWVVVPGGDGGARDGELVEGEAAGPKGRLGLPKARVIARLGDPGGPRAVSLIAIHQHGIPDVFSPDALREAEAAEAPGLEGREDLRHLDLVTIDPIDARDRDDAVLAVAEEDGGFTLWVAIADVAHYVRPGTALDRDARERGNSTYFPDRVVPMLPMALSGDLCSLHEGVDRACLAVRMRVDAEGRKTGHDFHRGVMRSRASLEYAQVQAAIDGQPDERTGPLLEPVLRPLYAAYAALRAERARREPLELDLPERRIELDAEGRVTSVAFKERLDAHRLIEEFMVAANVAAAEELGKRRVPLLYRVHEAPDPLKMEALREVAEASGLALARGQVVRTSTLNRLLAQAAGTDAAELINMAALRSMQQASYSPENLGHFGLALRDYAHFTSPIRRYADLVVHRALIRAHGWGPDGLTPAEAEGLAGTGEHVSNTERRSMAAERDTADRYLAAFLSERVGTEMAGRIAGVARFGLFVKLDETGADGLVPVRALGPEFFRFDGEAGTLTGTDSGVVFGLGMRATVRLQEVSPDTGGIVLELVTLEERRVASPGRPTRRLGQARGKATRERTERRVVRRR